MVQLPLTDSGPPRVDIRVVGRACELEAAHDNGSEPAGPSLLIEAHSGRTDVIKLSS